MLELLSNKGGNRDGKYELYKLRLKRQQPQNLKYRSHSGFYIKLQLYILGISFSIVVLLRRYLLVSCAVC